MRILINALFVIPDQVGGSETYLRCLLKALGDVDTDNHYIVCLGREAAATFDPPNAHWRVVSGPLNSAWRAGRLVLEQTWLPRVSAMLHSDMIHSAGYTGPLTSAGARVTTVHDMNYKRHPEDLSQAERAAYSALIPLVALRSHRVLTDSEAARKDILRWTPAKPSNVVAVHLGTTARWPGNPDDDALRLAAIGLSEPFILTVSAAYPHKNLRRLISAFPLRGRYRVQLVVAGLRGRADRELHRATKEHRGLVRMLGWVDDALLGSLYRRALALAFPSLYEGFGLPILEAMGVGTPVVTTAFGAMAEVAGDAADLVDPYDIESIRGGLERIVSDTAHRERLRRRGLERAAQFTWDATARKTLEVYAAANHAAESR
ncbi:MAG: glycosyltransferase family 4 protein [Frankiaceae bacterium]|nr:glycosyltransferase family 4 protein [Frankiaceae bacterium]